MPKGKPKNLDIYELRWEKEWGRAKKACWVLFRRDDSVKEKRVHIEAYPFRWSFEKAEFAAANYVRQRYELTGKPTQLLRYTQSGKIRKGGRAESSYGADSKRRKG